MTSTATPSSDSKCAAVAEFCFHAFENPLTAPYEPKKPTPPTNVITTPVSVPSPPPSRFSSTMIDVLTEIFHRFSDKAIRETILMGTTFPPNDSHIDVEMDTQQQQQPQSQQHHHHRRKSSFAKTLQYHDEIELKNQTATCGRIEPPSSSASPILAEHLYTPLPYRSSCPPEPHHHRTTSHCTLISPHSQSRTTTHLLSQHTSNSSISSSSKPLTSSALYNFAHDPLYDNNLIQLIFDMISCPDSIDLRGLELFILCCGVSFSTFASRAADIMNKYGSQEVVYHPHHAHHRRQHSNCYYQYDYQSLHQVNSQHAKFHDDDTDMNEPTSPLFISTSAAATKEPPTTTTPTKEKRLYLSGFLKFYLDSAVARPADVMFDLVGLGYTADLSRNPHVYDLLPIHIARVQSRWRTHIAAYCQHLWSLSQNRRSILLPLDHQQATQTAVLANNTTSTNPPTVGLTVQDTNGNWVPAQVVQFESSTHVRIRYVGWSEEWDEVLPIISARIRKANNDPIPPVLSWWNRVKACCVIQ